MNREHLRTNVPKGQRSVQCKYSTQTTWSIILLVYIHDLLYRNRGSLTSDSCDFEVRRRIFWESSTRVCKAMPYSRDDHAGDLHLSPPW
jgi:hypothetical protein